MTIIDPDPASSSIDEAQLEEFIHAFAGDFAAALPATTVVIGDKLGLYRALAELGPTAAAGLAERTGCDPRLVEEWLRAQYVSGYCRHSAATDTFWLTPSRRRYWPTRRARSSWSGA